MHLDLFLYLDDGASLGAKKSGDTGRMSIDAPSSGCGDLVGHRFILLWHVLSLGI
jgi:hypothetical protein